MADHSKYYYDYDRNDPNRPDPFKDSSQDFWEEDGISLTGNPYASPDSINLGAEPVILGGRIVGVKVNNKGNGFGNIPDIRINSKTGRGASLKAVMKFVPVS